MLSLTPRAVVAVTMLWTLTFTAPVRNSSWTGGPIALGNADPTAPSDTCRDATRFEVWRHRQSPTWVARHQAMQAADTTWARLWPVVRAEAAYQFVATRATTQLEAGHAVAITLPDTLALGWFYVAVTVDSAGNRSGRSAEIWR